jgi:hypothetical protein
MNKRIISFIALTSVVIAHPSLANPRIAVLNFELNDITSLPNSVQEQQRTATMRPLLEHALMQKGNYDIIPINADVQTAANSGFGYLFRHHDLAAKLGKQFGADWVIVSQHSKPSFLFSYLIADLVEVKTGSLVTRFDIELKGNHAKVTQRGIDALADKVVKTVSNAQPVFDD